MGHIALAFAPEDTAHLTDAKMREVTEQYMRLMGIANTPYIISRHLDKVHQHVHIAFSRVDNDGNVIDDRHDYKKNETVCKQLTLLHGLHLAKGKEHVNIDRLRKDDKAKYEIFLLMKRLLEECRSWGELQSKLSAEGVAMVIKRNPRTGVPQGISFCKGEFKYKGSKIDKSMSYSKIDRRLDQNARMTYDSGRRVSYRRWSAVATGAFTAPPNVGRRMASAVSQTAANILSQPTTPMGGHSSGGGAVYGGKRRKRWEEMTDEEKEAASRGLKI